MRTTHAPYAGGLLADRVASSQFRLHYRTRFVFKHGNILITASPFVHIAGNEVEYDLVFANHTLSGLAVVDRYCNKCVNPPAHTPGVLTNYDIMSFSITLLFDCPPACALKNVHFEWRAGRVRGRKRMRSRDD